MAGQVRRRALFGETAHRDSGRPSGDHSSRGDPSSPGDLPVPEYGLSLPERARPGYRRYHDRGTSGARQQRRGLYERVFLERCATACEAVKPGTIALQQTIPISGCAYAIIIQIRGWLLPAAVVEFENKPFGDKFWMLVAMRL